MAIRSMFFNAIQNGNSYDRVYSAEDFSGYLDKIVGDGVFGDPADNLQVKAQNTPNMTVYVNPGQGWIKGHKFISTETIVLDVDSASASADRYDSVNFYLDYENREMGVRLVKGTVGDNQPPTPVQTENVFWEYRLGVVKVYANTSSITQSLITDNRGSTVCPFVVGLIDQIDATALFADWNQQFNTWFSGIESQVSSLINQITGIERIEYRYYTTGSVRTFNVATYIPSYDPNADALELYISGLHLNPNDYTQSGTSITLINEVPRATVIDMVVYHITVGS